MTGRDRTPPPSSPSATGSDPGPGRGPDEDQGDEGDELRTRLLTAAATVFARDGYAGTRVMDIVRQAGLSAGALYGRFQSKNDLLREAVVRRSARGGYTAGTVRNLRGLFRGAARLVDEPLTDAEAMRLEAYVAARREPAVAQALGDALVTWRAHVQPLVDGAGSDGSLHPDLDPEAVLFLFRTLYLGLLLHRGSGLPSPDATTWLQLVDHLARALAQPLGEPSRRIGPQPAGPSDAGDAGDAAGAADRPGDGRDGPPEDER